MPHTQPMTPRRTRTQPPQLALTSAAFADGGMIPVHHTADGDDVSPHLSWSAPPPGTESIAIVCEDPDAPSGLFTHWILWDLDPTRRELATGVPDKAAMYGIIQGENGFGTLGWAGPSPPPGKAHRYVFRIYALDKLLGLDVGATRQELDEAIDGHVLGEGLLIGIYRR